MNSLASLQALIIDMDGVLWRGSEPLPGIPEFFAFLRERDIRFVLATNNSSRTEAQYAGRLAAYGAPVALDEIVTSASATADYLTSILPAGSRVYAIGLEGVRQALSERGFTLAEEDAAAVVVGIDWHTTYAQLKRAALLIRAGAIFVGTNPDATFPAPEGIIPGNGALLAAIETATSVKPIVIGKPEPLLYQQALRRLNTPLERTAALGDRLETDILGGIRAGLKTILVMGGVTTRAQLAASAYQPDWVFEDIIDVVREWNAE
ncbi:MAG TPA: HAD-IIA family hydrolase [Anaerolineae bacterium]|nr:HAD-IIA family hydrolase [Anaerolineae bacterium]